MKRQDQLLSAVVIALALAVAGPVTVRAVADAVCFQSNHDIAASDACNRRGRMSHEIATVGAPVLADSGVPSAEPAHPFQPDSNADDRQPAPEPDFVPVGRAWISPLGRDV